MLTPSLLCCHLILISLVVLCWRHKTPAFLSLVPSWVRIHSHCTTQRHLTYALCAPLLSLHTHTIYHIPCTCSILSLVPPWVRIYRIQRDIPMPLVTSGVEKGNLRELALARMAKLGLRCRCVCVCGWLRAVIVLILLRRSIQARAARFLRLPAQLLSCFCCVLNLVSLLSPSNAAGMCARVRLAFRTSTTRCV